MVFVYPNWWGTMPALMKGFFDRVLLPDFAFRYREGSALPDRLLSRRTAHLIVTMDTPPWYYRWIYRRPGHNAMKRTILGFCGIRVTKITEFSVVRNATSRMRARWIDRARRLGAGE
jgi:putative NADPH-quinone reductase